MSVEAVAWAKAQRCGSPTRKLALLVLAEACSVHEGSPEQVCWSGHRLLSYQSELSESALRQAIDDLAKDKLVEIRRRFTANGRQTSNVYVLPVSLTIGGAATEQGAATRQGEVPPHGRGEVPPHGTLIEPEDTNRKKEPQHARAYSAGELFPETAPEKTSPKKGTRLPEDWKPCEADWHYAVDHGVNPDIAAEEFANYWHARAGKDALKLDWSGTFRNRVLALAESGRFRVQNSASSARLSPAEMQGW